MLIFLEVPQGFAKTIEIEPLLPDLLLQFPDPAPGSGQCIILRCWHIDCTLLLRRPVNSYCPRRPAAPT
ncbi:hypothetical protein GOL82_30370 [Sinorhizobium medicae]|nr:hypothetical protein [Sinorhizobium medicae]MDX0420189.1 hypothetical protein [Sinorhizobium medicae]MDX1035410.1 hypothetical protein [Sinorhizobium medicae]